MELACVAGAKNGRQFQWGMRARTAIIGNMFHTPRVFHTITPPPPPRPRFLSFLHPLKTPKRILTSAVLLSELLLQLTEY